MALYIGGAPPPRRFSTPRTDHEAFDRYSLVRATVNDLLKAAHVHVERQDYTATANALWAVYENVWGSDLGMTWTGPDARNITDRYALLRLEVREHDAEIFLPEAPDAHKTEDIKPAE